MPRSSRFTSECHTLENRPLQTRFRFGSGNLALTLRVTFTSRLIMQKARGQSEITLDLPLLVSTRFQVLFHSPHRGSFHLSLTVLVHYRSLRSI